MKFSDIAPMMSLKALGYDIFLIMESSAKEKINELRGKAIDKDIDAYGTTDLKCYKVDLRALSAEEIPVVIPADITQPLMAGGAPMIGYEKAIVWSTSSANAVKIAKYDKYMNVVINITDFDKIKTVTVLNVESDSVSTMGLSELLPKALAREPLLLLGVSYV